MSVHCSHIICNVGNSEFSLVVMNSTQRFGMLMRRIHLQGQKEEKVSRMLLVDWQGQWLSWSQNSQGNEFHLKHILFKHLVEALCI